MRRLAEIMKNASDQICRVILENHLPQIWKGSYYSYWVYPITKDFSCGLRRTCEPPFRVIVPSDSVMSPPAQGCWLSMPCREDFKVQEHEDDYYQVGTI